MMAWILPDLVAAVKQEKLGIHQSYNKIIKKGYAKTSSNHPS
jgi:hypothetical protein